MSTKIKAKTKTAITLEQATNAAASYAMSTHAIAKREALLAEAVGKVKAKHEPMSTEATVLQEEARDILQAYAEQERDNWDGKSKVLAGVTIGFRSGKRAVQLPKNVTAAIMVDRLKNAGLKRYIRTVEELDKLTMLKEDKEQFVNQLEECGVTFGNSETFYIEVK